MLQIFLGDGKMEDGSKIRKSFSLEIAKEVKTMAKDINERNSYLIINLK